MKIFKQCLNIFNNKFEIKFNKAILTFFGIMFFYYCNYII